MSSNAKSVRDRTPKCSIVLSNVLAVVFRRTSTAVQHHCEHAKHGDDVENNRSKSVQQISGLELFDQFKEANRSTMLTRLHESLDDIRLKGWVFPFTLLIKGPHEDIEVIKEAWRRHFLRSPDNFIIRDIGKFSFIARKLSSIFWIDRRPWWLPSAEIKGFHVLVHVGWNIRSLWKVICEISIVAKCFPKCYFILIAPIVPRRFRMRSNLGTNTLHFLAVARSPSPDPVVINTVNWNSSPDLCEQGFTFVIGKRDDSGQVQYKW